MNCFYPMLCLAVESSGETGLFSADQMGGYAATVLITIINVAVAYIVIRLFVFKPILNVIRKREATIASQLDDAQKSKTEAAANAETSRQAIEDARMEASQIIEDARNQAQELAEESKKKAQNEADEILSRAEDEVLRMKKVAIEEMKDEISDLAVQVAGRVIGDVVDKGKLKSLADKHAADIVKEEVEKVEQ